MLSKRLGRVALTPNTRKTLLVLLAVNVLSVFHFSLTNEVGVAHQAAIHKLSLSQSRNNTALYNRLEARSGWKIPENRRAISRYQQPVKPRLKKKKPTPWPTMSPNPKSPLSTERYTIIMKSPMVNLSYTPVNTSQHPHKGAPWYNTSLLRLNPPTLKLPNISGDCQRNDVDAIAISRLRVATPEMIEKASNGRKPIRLLCVVYSSEPFHSRVDAVLETWASKCDGFFVASNVTDPNYNALNISHAGPESYDNMWHKIRSVWSYIYQTYPDFDYVHLCGEDAWVIVENLRLYLNGDELAIAANGGFELPEGNVTAQKPLYLGSRMAHETFYNTTYNTGGPGYTLNRAAVKLLVTQGLQYYSHETTSAEDVKVSQAFLKFGVHPYPTRDLETNSERYHHLNPGLHIFAGAIKRPHAWVDWWTKPFDVAKGMNHSSVYSAAFHYMEPDDMRRYHALLYGVCAPYRTDIDNELPENITYLTAEHSVKVKKSILDYKEEVRKQREKKRLEFIRKPYTNYRQYSNYQQYHKPSARSSRLAQLSQRLGLSRGFTFGQMPK